MKFVPSFIILSLISLNVLAFELSDLDPTYDKSAVRQKLRDIDPTKLIKLPEDKGSCVQSFSQSSYEFSILNSSGATMNYTINGKQFSLADEESIPHKFHRCTVSGCHGASCDPPPSIQFDYSLASGYQKKSYAVGEKSMESFVRVSDNEIDLRAGIQPSYTETLRQQESQKVQQEEALAKQRKAEERRQFEEMVAQAKAQAESERIRAKEEREEQEYKARQKKEQQELQARVKEQEEAARLAEMDRQQKLNDLKVKAVVDIFGALIGNKNQEQ